MVQGKAANRVLRKEPPSKGEIKKTDKLSVNDNFVSKLVKVKILSVISKQVFHECQFLFQFYQLPGCRKGLRSSIQFE